MSNLLGESFQKYVNDQIRVRQNLHGKKTGRTLKETQYLNTRNAWIKMASGVHIEQNRLDLLKSTGNELLGSIYEGKNLALKNVLFGGLTSFGLTTKNGQLDATNSIQREDQDTTFKKQFRKGITGGSYSRAYGVGGTDQFGYSPMPGIINMDMKCLNRGSIKKISLNIKCHNRAQFDVIDVLYLRLGYSVFIEWGYDKYLTNENSITSMGPTLIDKEFFQDIYDSSDYTKWIPLIEDKRKTTNGNYDGMFGTISNFSWTFEDDGTYNIKLEIISLGDIIESLKVNLPSVYFSKGSSFYGKKFAQLLEESSGGVEGQDNFYGKLYVGLKDSITEWYENLQNGEGNPTTFPPIPDITYGDKGSVVSSNLIGMGFPGTFEKDCFLKIKGSLGEDHKFFDTEGNLYKNPIVDAVNSTNPGEGDYYKISQEQIKTAIEYAIAAYYFWDFDSANMGTAARDKEDFDPQYRLQIRNGKCLKPWENLEMGTEKGEDRKQLVTLKTQVDFEWNGENYDYIMIYNRFYPLPYFKNGNRGIGKSFHRYYYPVTLNGDGSRSLDISGDYFDYRYIQGFSTTSGISTSAVAGTRGQFNKYYNAGTVSDKWQMVLQSSWTIEDFNTINVDGEGNVKAANWFNNASQGSNFASSTVQVGMSLEYLLQKVYEYFTGGRGKPYLPRAGNSLNFIQNNPDQFLYLCTGDCPQPYKYTKYAVGPPNYQGIGEEKGQAIPPSPESERLKELEDAKKQLEGQPPNPDEDPQAAQKREADAKAAQAEIDKLKSIRAQQVSDFKNQNKNRIYRYFYDIRDEIKNSQDIFTEGQVSQQNAIQDIGDVYLPSIPKPKYVGDVIKRTEDRIVSEGIEVFTSGLKLGGGYLIDGANWLATKLGADKGFFNNPIDKQQELEDIQKAQEKIKEYVLAEGESKNLLYLKKITPIDNQYFIRLGSFLGFLQADIIPKIVSSDDQKPMIRIDNAIDQNICYVIDNVFSLDITKIIVGNEFFINGLTNTDDPDSANSVPLFKEIDQYVHSLKGNSEIKYGKIMNIYFSFERLQEIFDTTTEKDDVYLFNALKDICNDINNSLGNINNIEPVIDEENIIHFIDQTSIPGLDQIAKELDIKGFTPDYTPESLQIFGYQGNKSNFVRSIGLTTEISKNYATMITIGATSNGAIPGVEATAFSRWNTGIRDRFKNNITDASTTEALEPLETEAGKEIQSNYATLLKETVGGEKGFGLFGLSLNVNDYVISEDDIDFNKGIVESFYTLMQAQNSFKGDKDEKGNTIESSIGFLPFNLKITLDGISGIKIYNKLNIQQKFLPSNYPEALEFIVTQVNHKLSNNDWITELETIATSKSVLTDKTKSK